MIKSRKIYEFTINVIVNMIAPKNITEAIFLESSDLPLQVGSKFDEFIINAARALTSNGFCLTDAHWSNRENSNSYYYAAVKHIDIINSDIKVIIFIRLSDHRLTHSDSRRDTARINYYDDAAQAMKKPVEKERQDWRFLDILVDDVECSSYQRAIHELTDQVEAIVHEVYEQQSDANA